MIHGRACVLVCVALPGDAERESIGSEVRVFRGPHRGDMGCARLFFVLVLVRGLSDSPVTVRSREVIVV